MRMRERYRSSIGSRFRGVSRAFIPEADRRNAASHLTPSGSKSVNIVVDHGLPGTLTLTGVPQNLQVLNPDQSPFTSATITGMGDRWCRR